MEKDIQWHDQVDVLIVGSGFAGLTAAIEAKIDKEVLLGAILRYNSFVQKGRDDDFQKDIGRIAGQCI